MSTSALFLTSEKSAERLTLTGLRLEDLLPLARVLTAVWAFDEMASPEGRLSTARHYLVESLLASNVAFVLREPAHGRPVGFLSARLPSVVQPGCPFLIPDLKAAAAETEALWLETTTPEERSRWDTEWFSGERAAAARFESREGALEAFATELTLFVVSPDSQSSGLGSRLYRAFETLHREKAPTAPIRLRTDSWCGWRFYLRQGFEKKAAVGILADGRPVSAEDLTAEETIVGEFFLFEKTFDR